MERERKDEGEMGVRTRAESEERVNGMNRSCEMKEGKEKEGK